MALDASKWRVNTDKTIEYMGPDHTTAGTNYVTVLELHRWLQDLADDASATPDDYMDITKDTPTEKAYDTIVTLTNGYTLHVASNTYQYIYGGSIIEGTAGVDQIIYDGVQVLAPKGMHLMLVQNGAVLTSDFWNSIPNGDSYKGINRDEANGISHQFMVKVHDYSGSGGDIDGRRLLGMTREWGKTYSEFKINGTSRGVNVMAFTGWTDDLNNDTAIGSLTGSPFTTVALTTAGYVGIDINGDTSDEYFYGEWTRGSASIKQFYERLKYLTRRGETNTLYGLPGQLFRGITHEITVDAPTGTFAAFEAVSWSGGTGQMLAINSTTAATKMWIQLLTGVAPTNDQVITGASTATATVNVTVTERSIPAPFVGISTGSTIIGGYGLGITPTDLTVNDKVFDLTNTQLQTPNLVTFTVSGLVSGEDYILVGPDTGATALDLDQLTLNTSLTTDNITSVVVTTTIPTDTPSSGYIRVADDNGRYRRLHYSSYTGSTFTVDETSGEEDFASVNATSGNNVFIAYIDKLANATTASFQSTYVSDRALFVRRRDGGAGSPTKTFENAATLTSTGGSISVQRLSDA